MNKLSLVLALISLTLFVRAKEIKIVSPDKKTALIINTHQGNDQVLSYAILHEGQILIDASPLGLAFENEHPLSGNLEVLSVKEELVNDKWKPAYGEKSSYLNHYKSVIIQFKESKAPYRAFSINCRVYNEGVAFKYNISTQKQVTITAELTGFKFKKDHTSWVAKHSQAAYKKATISKTINGCERPYVIEIDPNCYIAIGEAALVDYAQMKFNRAPQDSLLLVTSLSSKAVFTEDFSTPWRYVMVARSPGELLANNHFILNLNHPSAIKDVSWIKPGKVIREVTLTTTGGKACIDFAAKHNLQYIEFDAGWYGPEFDKSASALAVNVDSSRSPGPLNIHEVIAYGKTKGVGVILYVNQTALSKQLDSILPLYRKWGVKGIKYGFVSVGAQQNITWLHEAIRKAAENKMMLDIHDDYRPTGYSRTYPNLLTQEGVRGDEESPDNEQALMTMFTRMLAGAADATNCYFAPRVDVMGSHASQMAKAICIYSPWQFVYWYDRPVGSPTKKGGAGSVANTTKGGTGAKPSVIEEIPDLSFYDALPTVWDDTKVLDGKIGEYGTIARRSGNNWFVGTLTNQARNFKLSLDFLTKGVKYEATIYSDDISLPTTTKIAIKKMKVDNGTILDVNLMLKQGQAIIIKAL